MRREPELKLIMENGGEAPQTCDVSANTLMFKLVFCQVK